MIKQQIDGEVIRAFDCQKESMSNADFSLNPPPECRMEDGSAYNRPIEKKAQILERVRRIPIEITTCVVQWRESMCWKIICTQTLKPSEPTYSPCTYNVMKQILMIQ